MKRLLTITALAMLAAAALAAPAMGAFGFKDLDVTFTNEDGSIATQAGSHPFAMTTSFTVNTFTEGGLEMPEGEAKDLTLRQIEGFAGNPTATPRCSSAQFVELFDDTEEGTGASSCPDESAIGIAAVRAAFSPVTPGEDDYFHLPVYNLTPPPGAAAKIGFVVLNEPVTVEIGVSEKYPHNVVAKLTNVPQILVFYASRVTLWGNPASPAHDNLRGRCVGGLFVATDKPFSRGTCPVETPEKPFLTLPRACLGPLATTLEATSWDGFPEAKDSTLTPPMDGCEGFDAFPPVIDTKASTTAAESASGIDFAIKVDDPGLTSPEGAAQSDIKKIEATLPAGVTANPSAANGLGACSIAQYEAAALNVGGCPEDSTLGSVEVQTPILENRTLKGTVYLAEQNSNPFNSLLAFYMVIRDPELGVVVKQAAKVEPDPNTGQLTTTVDEIPQFPLSFVNLRLRQGPRAPLVTPPTCGTYTTKATITPWSGGIPVQAASSFEVTSGPNGSPCPSATPPFKPGFEAGTTNNNAGSYSPTNMRITRQDGEREITRLDAIFPKGLTGKLAGVAQCSDAAIAAAANKSGRDELANPSCPGNSRIGRVLAGAGVGSSLTYVPGTIYLGGPFAGDPLSVVVITPAVTGPFDVGTVVIREGLDLNSETAEVTVDGASSTPIPRILKGIPLKLRDLRVFVDRQNFTLNATSCNPSAFKATLFSVNFPTELTSRYQAANCAALGFKPRLSLKLKGATKRGKFPALRAELKPRPGDANIGKAVVTLAHSSFLAQEHIRTICTRVQFAADACPKGSIYGKARAFTPLLDKPLEGPVYLRSSSNPLPDMVASLRGIVDIDLVGRIDSVNASIRTSFDAPPDAPVSKFVLEMQGGKKGLIVNSRNLCSSPSKANAVFTGQNGKRHTFKPLVKNSCKKKGKGKQSKKRSGKR